MTDAERPAARPDPWRRAFAWVYWGFTIMLGTSVALGATLGAFTHPAPDPATAAPEGVTPSDDNGRACVQRLSALHDALTQRAGEAFSGGAHAGDLSAAWGEGSRRWRRELAVTRADCRLDESEAMQPVARLADGLGRLDLAYTTAVLGFSDVGRVKLDEVHEALDALNRP